MKPHQTAGWDDKPYLHRWYIIESRWLNVMLHHFLSDDEPGVVHNHPWFSLSIRLWGRLEEYTPGKGWKKCPLIKFRNTTEEHTTRTNGCWTLFITGPSIRKCIYRRI